MSYAILGKLKAIMMNPLRGKQQGQRSIRLTKQYRAIYIIRDNGEIECIEIIEVIPHAY